MCLENESAVRSRAGSNEILSSATEPSDTSIEKADDDVEHVAVSEDKAPLLEAAATRRNRGRGSQNIQYCRLKSSPLQSTTDLLRSANSNSIKSSVRRAKNLILCYEKIHQALDPVQVTPGSSEFVMNLIAEYCNSGKPSSLNNGAMGCLVQGLSTASNRFDVQLAASVAKR